MSYLDMLLADRDQERTITIKTKPQKEQKPEMPMDAKSANLPQNIIDLMQMQNMAMNGMQPMGLDQMLQDPSVQRSFAAGIPLNAFRPEGPLTQEQFNFTPDGREALRQMRRQAGGGMIPEILNMLINGDAGTEGGGGGQFPPPSTMPRNFWGDGIGGGH